MDPQYPFCSGTSSSNTCLRFLGIFIATVASTARCQHLSTNSIHTALSESTSSPSSLSWESAWIVPADQQLVEVTDLGVHSLKTKIDLPRCSEYFSIVIVMKLSHLIWINSWKVQSPETMAVARNTAIATSLSSGTLSLAAAPHTIPNKNTPSGQDGVFQTLLVVYLQTTFVRTKSRLWIFVVLSKSGKFPRPHHKCEQIEYFLIWLEATGK